MKIEKREIKPAQTQSDCQCNYQNNYYGDQVCRQAEKK